MKKTKLVNSKIVKLTLLCCVLGVSALGNGGETKAQDESGLVQSGLLGVWDVRPARKRQEGEGERSPRHGQTGNRAPVKMPDVEGLDVGDRAVFRIMTTAGRTAFASMNPRDLPTNNCMSSGLPTLAKVPNVQEWTLADDVLTIHYGEFDTFRYIYLDGRSAASSPTQLGHSTGEFANGVLTITTSNLTESLGALARNAPGSAQRTIKEVYQVTEAGRRISGTITIEDPLFLTQEIETSVNLLRAAAGTEVLSFPCDVASSQRYLD
ncbi:MAG: hypothetical protein ACSHXZ_00410 [Gammaproteobacteria bacterium]